MNAFRSRMRFGLPDRHGWRTQPNTANAIPGYVDIPRDRQGRGTRDAVVEEEPLAACVRKREVREHQVARAPLRFSSRQVLGRHESVAEECQLVSKAPPRPVPEVPGVIPPLGEVAAVSAVVEGELELIRRAGQLEATRIAFGASFFTNTAPYRHDQLVSARCCHSRPSPALRDACPVPLHTHSISIRNDGRP